MRVFPSAASRGGNPHASQSLVVDVAMDKTVAFFSSFGVGAAPRYVGCSRGRFGMLWAVGGRRECAYVRAKDGALHMYGMTLFDHSKYS
jgi:hypothetical protein